MIIQLNRAANRVVVFSVLLAFFSLVIPAREGFAERCFSTLWPHELSDLRHDPSVTFGRLENGFRYIIKRNTTPRQRVALYLNVQAGSLHEEDHERGYAHYLEHMLFNGTTHFPPGKLIEYFQTIGMSFGADTNAYTTFTETVYKIVLPEGNLEDIRQGLLVIADYSEGALLLEEEVDRERGVILAEKTARDSVQFRIRQAKNKVAFQGTLLSERMPIGVEQTIVAADGKLLRNFYDKWYRPDNVVLVIVGDMQPDLVENEVRKTFSSFHPRATQPQCPDIGNINTSETQGFYYFEPETGKVTVSLESYWNQQPKNDGDLTQREEIIEYIASSILQKRLERMSLRQGKFYYPHAYSGEVAEEIGYSGVTASTSAEHWRFTLNILEKATRQLLLYGIEESELEIAKKEIESYYAEQVSTEANQKSTAVASRLIRSVNNNRVFQSPSQEYDLVQKHLDEIVSADVQSVFHDQWQKGKKVVQVSGNVQLNGESPEKSILAEYNQSLSVPVVRFKSSQQKSFPYLVYETQLVQPSFSEKFEKIDVFRAVYENGAIINLKKTEFQQNKVAITINFGLGQREETHGGMSMLAESIFQASGTGQLTAPELENSLAGTSLQYAFTITPKSFQLRGEALTAEAELLVQLLHSLYVDPGFRQQVYARKIERFRQMYDSMKSSIRGAESLYVDRFFAGGSEFYGMPNWESVARISFDDLRRWLVHSFKGSTPEISVVGDFNQKEMVEILGRYFGTMVTTERKTIDVAPVAFPAGKNKTVSIASKIDKARIIYAWKTEGMGDIHVVRRLNMLASVLEERVRLKIREELGAAYSPVVYNHASRIVPGLGILYIKLTVEKERVAAVKKAVQAIIADLEYREISEEEVARVKKPLLTALRDRLRTNRYWLHSVLSGSKYYPGQLEWPITLISDNETITAQELNDYARRYLYTAKGAEALITPE